MNTENKEILFFSEEEISKQKTTGYLQKDYMIFSELFQIQFKDEILRGIQYFFDQTIEPKENENAKEVEEAKQISDISNLEDDELKMVRIDVNVFSQNPLTFLDIHAFTKSIDSSFFRINKLHFANCKLSKYSIYQISKSIKQRGGIDTFEMVRNSFHDDGDSEEERLFPLKYHERKNKGKLNRNPLYYIFKRKIKNISLKNCGINDEDMKTISNLVSKSSCLQTLRLFGNNISDDGCQTLSNALISNCSLLALSLAMNNKITNLGIKAIFEAFKNRKLESYSSLVDIRLKKYQSFYENEEIKGIEQIPFSPSMKRIEKALLATVSNKKDKNCVTLLPKEIELIEVIESVDPQSIPKKKKKDVEGVDYDSKFKFLINGNKNMQFLNFSCIRNIDDTCLEDIESLLPNSGIRKIFLSNTNLSKEKITKLNDSLKAMEEQKKEEVRVEATDEEPKSKEKKNKK